MAETLDDPPPDFSRLVRADSIWFSDGNIILIAKDVAFKVHKGQLERHSEVFRDLFCVPQPNGQPLFEGCHWVELHDSPEDLLYLLRALYDGLYLEEPQAPADDFLVIAGVLRLATKYIIEHLRKQCISKLTSDWPSTLAQWDGREKRATDKRGQYNPRDSYPHPLLLMDLALEMGLAELLPSAYYDLSRYGPKRIVTGATLPSHKVRFLVDNSRRAGDDAMTKADTDGDAKVGIVLGNDILCEVLRGREVGQRHLAMFIEQELVSRPPASRCSNKHNESGRVCRESSYYIMLNILRAVGGISHGRDADPLYTMAQVVEMLSRTDFTDGERCSGLKMCTPCNLDLAECVERARKSAWDLIPSWFQMAPWKESASRPEVPEGGIAGGE